MNPRSHERNGEARARILLILRRLARWRTEGADPAPDRISGHANGLEAMSDWPNVAAAGEFGPGQYRVIDADEVEIAVFNLDGEYFAIEDVCTHDIGTLTGGCVEGGGIMCPRRGARFDIRTGEAAHASGLRARRHVPGAGPRRRRPGPGGVTPERRRESVRRSRRSERT